MGLPAHSFLNVLHGRDCHAKPVNSDANLIAVRKMTCKPLWNKHLARDTGLMQLNSRGRELLRGLDEITSVRPKTGAILCDDKVTLPSVAGKPCHLMPAGC